MSSTKIGQCSTINAFTTEERTKLAGLTGISYEIVAALPASGTAGVIYLVLDSHGSGDSYDEFVWVNDTFEKLGHTDIDLSGYLQSSSVVTNAQIDNIFANNSVSSGTS